MNVIDPTARLDVLERIRLQGLTLPVLSINSLGNDFYAVWLYSLSQPVLIDMSPMPAKTWQDYLKLAWGAWRGS